LSFSGYIKSFGTPEITLSLNLTDPQDVIVQKGQQAVLKCLAESRKGSVQITWQHNNKTILENSTKWKIQENGDLYIPKVFGKKANGVMGEYRCLARNQAGALLSSVAKLSIASMEKEFSRHPDNVTVPEFQPAILQCGIHSNPPADIQFEFNNTILPHEARYVPLSNRALLIENSHLSVSGTYRCRARNNILDKIKYSKIAVVKVLPNADEPVAPNFLPLDIKLNNNVNVGEKFTLYCAVIGWPTPTVQWLKEDRVISNSTILEIAVARTYHSGNYTCLAFNKAGRISQKHRVEVQQRPFFKETPLSKYYPSAMTARLRCSAGGIPEPRVTWLKDGRPLRFGARIKLDNVTLILSHTFTTDSGIYQCVATNSVGSVWTAAQIEIAGSSSRPHSLTCRPLDSSRICLSWKPPHNSSAQFYSGYSFYKANGSEIAGPEYVTNLTYQEVTGLYSSTTYMFYVRSYSNKASDASENVTCTTGVMGNRNLDIEPTGENSVSLRWSEISSDVTCSDKRFPYKVQWKRLDQRLIDVIETENRSLIINGLLPGTEYGFKVTSANETDGGMWILYTTSDLSNTSSGNPSRSDESAAKPPPPEAMRVSALSPCSVTLRWQSLHRNVKYFTICYAAVAQNVKCDSRKSFTNVFQIDHLTPNTAYQFKIRAHNFEGVPGAFSKPFTVRTPADVPSKIENVKYNLINDSTVRLHWRAPSDNGKKLLYYNISYTSDINSPIESWKNVTVPADSESVSTYVGNLTAGAHYHVMVRAVSEVGIGKINALLEFSMTRIVQDSSVSGDESRYHKKVGLIIGTLIALLCIACCAACILARRRCVKRRNAAAAARAGDDGRRPLGYPAAAHYAAQVGAVQVRLEEAATRPDVEESERLMVERRVARLPPTSPHRLLDTKGSEQFRNGYANGCTTPLMNGHLHITENPQFNQYRRNGPHSAKIPLISRYTEDANSNVKPSKFHDLDRIFEQSKTSKSPDRHRRCDPHFGEQDGDSRRSSSCSCDDVRSVESGDSLNATRTTCLDDTMKSAANNCRRNSPLVGPNG
ncbi:unnamed protein product, partial [Phaedon cochleariae]